MKKKRYRILRREGWYYAQEKALFGWIDCDMYPAFNAEDAEKHLREYLRQEQYVVKEMEI